MSTLVMERPLIKNLDLPIYTVVIHKNEDGAGYWAKCKFPDGCAFTDGDSIYETERNMYESVALYLQDDYPQIPDFSLKFVMAYE